jgi:hypothetical protein
MLLVRASRNRSRSRAWLGLSTPAQATARAERQREAHADLVRGVVERREDDSGFGDRQPVLGADRADAVHPAQRQEQGRPVRRRSRAGRHAGIAALGNERDAMLGGEADDLGDLFGRRGRQHRRCGAVDAAAPVAHPRLDLS